MTDSGVVRGTGPGDVVKVLNRGTKVRTLGPSCKRRVVGLYFEIFTFSLTKDGNEEEG